jgi:abortive infection bacteriophage resistance protein
MNYLRKKKHISISGSSQKRKLRNIGYYHGFKGYRFIRRPSQQITFSDFNEVLAINKFDMDLKALLYPQIMFIETALKNYVLEVVLYQAKTESFNIIYDYKKALSRRLRFRNQIYGVLNREYNKDREVVRHFYQKDAPVPI